MPTFRIRKVLGLFCLLCAVVLSSGAGLVDDRVRTTDFTLADAVVDANGVATLDLTAAIPATPTELRVEIACSVRNYLVLHAFACNGGNTGAFVYRAGLDPTVEQVVLVPGRTVPPGGVEITADPARKRVVVVCDTVMPPSLRAVMDRLNRHFGVAYMFAAPDGQEGTTPWNDPVAGFMPDGFGGGWVDDNPAAGVYARPHLVTAANQHPYGVANPGARRGLCRILVDGVATGGDEEVVSEIFYHQPEPPEGTWGEMTHGRAIYTVRGSDGVLAGSSESSRGLTRADGTVWFSAVTRPERAFVHPPGAKQTLLVVDPGHFGDWPVLAAADNATPLYFSAGPRLELADLQVRVVAW